MTSFVPTIFAPGFYAIVDPEHCALSPIETAEAILAGGCSVIQLRDKKSDERSILALALEIKARAHAAGVPFVINDRVDLALLAMADGVHLGQTDLPVPEVRKIFEGHIGLSTHNLAQFESALDDAPDLIALGPIFDTASKENPDPTVGLTLLETVAGRSPVPTVAIGGVRLDRAAELKATGVTMAAAIGAVCKSNDPQNAARALHEALQ